MADEEMVEEAPADPAAGFATALIVLTTVMLLVAIIVTMKTTGDHYHEGMLASK